MFLPAWIGCAGLVKCLVKRLNFMEFMFDAELITVYKNQIDYLNYLKTPFNMLDDEIAIELDIALNELDYILDEMKKRSLFNEQ